MLMSHHLPVQAPDRLIGGMIHRLRLHYDHLREGTYTWNAMCVMDGQQGLLVTRRRQGNNA